MVCVAYPARSEASAYNHRLKCFAMRDILQTTSIHSSQGQHINENTCLTVQI